MTMSNTEIKMRERINEKIEKAGATSKKTAVTITEAELDAQEQYWLPYLLGGFNCNIQKTSDNKYYYKDYAQNKKLA